MVSTDNVGKLAKQDHRGLERLRVSQLTAEVTAIGGEQNPLVSRCFGEHQNVRGTAQSLIADVDRLVSGQVEVVAHTRGEVLVNEKSHAGGLRG